MPDEDRELLRKLIKQYNLKDAAYLVKVLRPKLKYISVISSYGWGGKTVEMLTDLISTLKAEIIEPVVIKGYPKDGDFKLLDGLADKIILKHKELADNGMIY